MPRVTPRLLREAQRVHRLLPLLLPACRTIEQCKAEFRWIRNELSNDIETVRKACLQRYKLVPLQYILGSQPFGELNIGCHPGVLIPRWETEEWVCELSERLIQKGVSHRDFTIWDLCCGTGCVGLLLQSRLRCKLVSVDISGEAVRTCEENAVQNDLEMPETIIGNVLEDKNIRLDSSCDRISLLTCNPPYIPRRHFAASTSPSVKRFEPHLALIGDLEFYGSLLQRWIHCTDSFVYEVGDRRQVEYVVDGIKGDPRLSLEWCVGHRLDSAGQVRVVFGYRAGSPVSSALKSYGPLIHEAAEMKT